MTNKHCIIIVGPTGVGKTALSLQLAGELKTEIISADSRQCYHELNIGVAKPSIEDLQKVKHHFVNSHSVHDNVNTGVFERYAMHAAGTIFEQHHSVVMVGGTGLYIRAFCEGVDDIPEVSLQVRNDLQSNYEKYGLPWLRSQVEKHDPGIFSNEEMSNPHRLMRSLEIRLTTSKSIRSFQTKQQKQRDFSVTKIGLQLPRETLYHNINKRVEDMIATGLVNEVEALISFRGLNALNTVGYKEIFDHLEGKATLAQAVELIKQNTRHYAKRQMTWFKKDAAIKWFAPDQFSAIATYIHTK